MIYKNQILAFIISFLIGVFFLLSTPEAGFSGGFGTICCEDNNVEDFPVCTSSPQMCEVIFEGSVCASGIMCVDVAPCICPPPPVVIPTLSQYGMIIMAGVLGLFAVIGLFVMRRRNVVMPSS